MKKPTLKSKLYYTTLVAFADYLRNSALAGLRKRVHPKDERGMEIYIMLEQTIEALYEHCADLKL